MKDAERLALAARVRDACVAAAIDNANSAITWPPATAGPWTYNGPTAAPIVSYADDDKLAVTATSAEGLHAAAQAACNAVEDFMNSCSYNVNLAPDGTKTVLYLTAPSSGEDEADEEDDEKSADGEEDEFDFEHVAQENILIREKVSHTWKIRTPIFQTSWNI